MRNVLIGALATLLVPAAHAGEITVSFSEDLTKKITEDYGAREGDYLAEEVIEEIREGLGDRLDTLGDIHVTFIDAKPNRPTFKELGDRIGLSMQSFGLGGAKLEAIVYDLDGEEFTTIDYNYFSNEIRESRYKATWSDARRAINRFVDKLEDKVEETASDSVG